MTDLNKEMNFSSRGADILARINTVSAASGKDSIGDDRMARAISILKSDKLPRLQASPSEGEDKLPTIRNWELVKSMGIVDIISDSIATVGEAVKLWQRKRLEENQHRIKKWVGERCH